MVVTEFVLDVREMRVEFISFGRTCVIQVFICHVHSYRDASASRQEEWEAMKRARPQSMSRPEAVPRACSGYTGERAQLGAFARSRARYGGLVKSRRVEVWNVSGRASLAVTLDSVVVEGQFRECWSPVS